jgi:outer membrane protein OmpA-like peptidoglycan-associated protein
MMAVRTILAAGALLAAPSAMAQTAPVSQAAQELACQLSGQCEEEAEGPAEEATASPAAGAPRVSATRGFKIERKTTAAPASNSGYTATKPATAKPRAAYQSGKKAAAPAAGKSSAMVKSKAAVAANAKAMPKGRADLRVTFVTGSAELTEAGQRSAQDFAAALGTPLLQGMRFTIEGHTDAVGAREYNLDLSRRRAQAVVDYLVGKGVDRSRFDVVGHGFDKPLEGTSATAAVNRRVEVVRNK